MPNDPKKIPLQSPDEYTPKTTMKSQGKSMFDNQNKKPQTQQEFQQKVQASQEQMAGYKKRAAELFMLFQRSMADKTLAQNRNILNSETEKEMLQHILQLAIDIDNDPQEQEGMGTMTAITLLLKTCLSQRDRINELEYALAVLQKKVDGPALAEFVNKEIAKALDTKKTSG